MKTLIKLGMILATCAIMVASAMAQQLGFNFYRPRQL